MNLPPAAVRDAGLAPAWLEAASMPPSPDRSLVLGVLETVATWLTEQRAA